MVTIIFESHSTTIDNEQHRASGHNDVELSAIGLTQARQLGDRYAGDRFDAIFCSDLQRSYKTGKIAFGSKGWPIIRDARLRECDYGELTQHPSAEVDPAKIKHITAPFPGGESYEDAVRRVGEFLRDLLRDHDGQRVMIIGHRATQYGLERWIKGVPIAETVAAPWHWQPGWTYELKELKGEAT
jgi:broad specificity phosphatase PhoE